MSNESKKECIAFLRLRYLKVQRKERQRRLVVAAEAMALGYGGIKYLSTITGISVPTIRRGIQGLESRGKKSSGERIRIEGGGRKKLTPRNPGNFTNKAQGNWRQPQGSEANCYVFGR